MMRSAVSEVSGLRPGCVRVQPFEFIQQSGQSGLFFKNHIGEYSIRESGLMVSYIKNWPQTTANPANTNLLFKIKRFACPGFFRNMANPDADTVERADKPEKHLRVLSYFR